MATHEIPREKWAEFFSDFSRRRQGALVEIESVSPSDGIKHETAWLPFAGISLETKGGEAGAVEIMTGTEAERHVTHVISAPRQVYHKDATGVMSSEVTHDEIVEVTTAGEPPVTYLRFKPAH